MITGVSCSLNFVDGLVYVEFYVVTGKMQKNSCISLEIITELGM